MTINGMKILTPLKGLSEYMRKVLTPRQPEIAQEPKSENKAASKA